MCFQKNVDICELFVNIINIELKVIVNKINGIIHINSLDINSIKK